MTDHLFLVAEGQNSRTMDDVLRNNNGCFKWDQSAGFALRLYARCNNGEANDFIILVVSTSPEDTWTLSTPGR